MSEALTVRAALQLPALRGGAPEVIAGRENLDRPIRWVHVVEVRDIASVLRGGELVLTEGRMFHGPEASDRRLIAELAERGIAAMVLELGANFRSVPRHLIDECQKRNLTLVALHLPVAFIDVTEAIHTQIVNQKITLLDHAQELQRRLTELVLEGGGIAEVLDALAAAVGEPVLYERAGGGFVYRALNGLTERDVTAGWELITRCVDSAPPFIEKHLTIDGARDGRLVALGLSIAEGGGFDEVATVALERAAQVVSLIVIGNRRRDAVFANHGRHGGLLTSLLAGSTEPYAAEARAVALGFTPPVLVPIGIRRARHHRAATVAAEDHQWRLVWRDVHTELENIGIPALIDETTTAGPTLAMIGVEDVANRSRIADRVAQVIQDAAKRHLGEPRAAVLSVGPAVHTWQAATEGLAVSVDALEGALHSPPRAWHDATDLDLDRLIWSLRDNPDLERFARLRLERLVNYDAQRHTQLVKTLQVLLEQHGQKTETARALHLERQSLYNRVERIQSLLGVDLDDSDVRLGLHLALRVLSHIPTDQI
ncbi:PucR family transcriptional regulator [Mycolicibacterium smegmatis]|uniref:PucR family transcriptional regulator n=1 Tax=Mycolicibacterium smegmatis TaxID=1772 RepID=UPI0009C0C016|nr:PucR family transcriptional regulator [Mycolicibacterium smegmatis]MDF1900802.1 PucR family transcriptional regulator [Mycolicibacterium smegmatis]MDF1907081.1 PucR family transcriptional regulator [Mycolicibacterium smegmatis]MDF1919276.1 PucR family transcriptional regulator [Mycolicibacterium smegmatis]MDF1925343.1 PucR family transcriptional regulator [Mycolicibacterium smegmatis]UAK52871.1 PucR family transcriptional regulator [Mycolicibacterium smegmatis]